MTTKTATRSTKATKPAPAKAPAPEATKPDAKGAAPKEQKPAKPVPSTLLDALTTGQATLVKVRANGTIRSLPYLAVGTEERTQAEVVAAQRQAGTTAEAIAETRAVSVATVRRFVSNLALAHAVEAGTHDAAWTVGTKQVVVQRVQAKAEAQTD